MVEFLNNPTVQILFLPFFGSALLTGLILLLGRRKSGDGSGIGLANASVGAGFAWVAALILGTPTLPPAFNSSAILSATVALLAVGIILDLYLNQTTKFGRLIETVAIILCSIGIAAWMGGVIDFWSMPILIACGAVFFCLQRIGSNDAFGSGDATLILATAAFGLGLISWISGIAIDRDLAFGLATTSLGFYVWNLPRPRLYFGRSILLAGGGGLCMIALRLIEQAPPLIPAIILLGFIFFVDTASQYVPNRFKIIRLLPSSLILFILAVIPISLAAMAAVIAIEFQFN